MEKPFPAYRGDEPYVFVCYAHEDASVVYPELQWLRDGGVNVYYDEGVSPGHEWTQELADAIDGSSQVLYFVSPSSVASRHCRNEVQYALEQAKSLVSAFLEPTELPGGLKLSLGPVQAIMKYELSTDEYRRKLASTFRFSKTPPDSEAEPRPAHRPSRWRLGAVGLITFALIAAAGVWWLRQGGSVQPNPSAETSTITSARSVAVLPFVNMSKDPEQEFFSDGISEDILNELARTTDLTVRPRSSSFMFKAADLDSQSIGQQLAVTHVVEGSVRKSGEQIRVNVQLIEVASNRPVWSERYERTLVDIFNVQDEITNEILTALDVHLGSPRSPREFANQEAYDAFLRGRYAFSQYQFGEADDWLAKAVALDPRSAEAWAMRAQVNAYQSALELSPNSGEHRNLRRHYVGKALSLDSANALALGVDALMDTHYIDRDYQAAVNEFVRLVRLHPNNEDLLIYLTFVLATIGKADLVDAVTAKLVRLAPLSRNAWVARIGFGPLLFGDVEDARGEMEKFPSVGPIIAAQIALASRDAEALEMINLAGGLRGSDISTIYAALVPYLRGDLESAQAIVAELDKSEGYQSYRIRAFAALVEEDTDGAFRNYRKAVLAGEQSAISGIHGRIAWRRVFPEFYSDPRFSQMLKDFKLDPDSTAKIQVPNLPF